ncbi:MAG: hypothetical protein OEO23_10160, partial [Gemmatimonadota bacterium]|nr:hypothetical protein [Gemmatimonadota bacterium]
MKPSPALLLALVLLVLVPEALHAQERRDPRPVTIDSVFHGLQARAIGPAGTSGRIAALAVAPNDHRVIYAGAATGGLWRSVDGGLTWSPLMDDTPVNSIGAVAVSPTSPDIIWVGTGEANARNSMGVGRGVWKSIDGGESWTHMGLPRTEHIEAIIPHPTDPDVVWLSAMGPAWSAGDQRGIFRTRDGGRTWDNVLYVDDTSGGFELVMDPSNPLHLLASTWQFRREPWFMRS